MNINFKRGLLFIIAGILISSCGGGGSSSSSGGGGANVYSTPSPITIDNAGTVPVMGQSSTSSIVYVHNNTNRVIKGITYSANDNSVSQGSVAKMLKFAKRVLGIKSSLGSFLNSSSASQCSEIQPGQSCPLAFTTPVLDIKSAQGSAEITASYEYAGKERSFSQIINYVIVTPAANIENGAIFASGVIIQGFGNDVGYATVYMYGSGINQVYNVNSITSDKVGVTLTQGDITGRQIQSGFIQAVEVSAQTQRQNSQNISTGYNVKLNVDSSNLLSGGFFDQFAFISVSSFGAGAILTSGLVPLINSASASPTGTLYIINSGDQQATSINIAYGAGINSAGGGTCGAILAAGASCTINFSVTQASGSGNITITYSGAASGFGSLAQTVVWYNGRGGQLLQMTANPSPLVFNSTIGESATVTVTNIGGFNLSGVNVPSPSVFSGSATALISSSGNTCESSVLSIGSFCQYVVDVNDPATDPSATMNLLIAGSYNDGSVKTYLRAMALNYTSVAYAPNLSITPSPAIMTINGDGESTVNQTLTVTNNGPASATIESSFLTSSPSFLTIATDNCINETLAESGTCTVILSLGPRGTSTLESGTIVYSTKYYGGQVTIGSPSTATDNINYTVLADQQNFSLESVIASNTSSGNGESVNSSFIFEGNNTSPQKITLVYVNRGTNTLRITGESNANSAISWLFESSNSTCFLNNTATLIGENESCVMVFQNVLADNMNAAVNIGSSYNVNLTVPTFIFQDDVVSSAQFVLQPTLPTPPFPSSSITVFAKNHQATVANTASESGNVVMVTNSLANATGYANITLTSDMEDYFESATPSSGCTPSVTGTIRTQVCTLSPNGSGVDIESVAYSVAPQFQSESLILNVLFSISPASQAVTMSQLATQVPIQ